MTKICVLLLASMAALWCQKFDPPYRLPESVEMKADLVYASPGGHELHLDLFLPKSGAGPFPAVVYVHGGGFSKGNKKSFWRQAAYMATKGFVGACIEYRLSGEARYPAALYDAKAAVRWLRGHAAEYRIAADRIGAAGGSAGGHLVAMLGTTGDQPAFEEQGHPDISSRVRAVAAFNPAVDLISIGKNPATSSAASASQFLGCKYAENPELWEQATPLTHVSKDAAAFLLLHGTADKEVSYRQSVDMLNKLTKAGVHAEIFTAKDADHGFFQSPPFYQPATERMAAFFVEWLR